MKWFLRVFGTTLAFTIIAMSVFRTEGWYSTEVWWLQETLGGDKATHALGGAILMLTAAAWSCAWRSWRRLLLHIVIVMTGILLEECSQYFFSNRQFSMMDYAYSAAGVLLMASLFAWYLIINQAISQRRLHYKS